MGQMGQMEKARLSQFFLVKSAFKGRISIKSLKWDKWDK
jgi:hypothetical protein